MSVYTEEDCKYRSIFPQRGISDAESPWRGSSWKVASEEKSQESTLSN